MSGDEHSLVNEFLGGTPTPEPGGGDESEVASAYFQEPAAEYADYDEPDADYYEPSLEDEIGDYIDERVGSLYEDRELLEADRVRWDAERERQHAAQDGIEVEAISSQIDEAVGQIGRRAGLGSEENTSLIRSHADSLFNTLQRQYEASGEWADFTYDDRVELARQVLAQSAREVRSAYVMKRALDKV